MVRFGAKKVEAIPPFLFYINYLMHIQKQKKREQSRFYIFLRNQSLYL
jgi:hypothetical protein